MFLPPRQKPDMFRADNESIIEIPNVITKDTANRLINYALDTDISGWHVRGSKSSHVRANFSCCLVYRLDDPIYEMLDSLWEQYAVKINPNLTFIEQYEIKCYNPGDEFGVHNDGYRYATCENDRKINLTIQLTESDAYSGGDLYIGKYKCSREFGTAIFYPAHYFHGVSTVEQGQRFALIGHGWGPYMA